jgi:tryptophan synthase alpha chain
VSRISKVFKALKNQRKGALIGFITGGDPEPRYTPMIAEALVKGGVDILELGIPFSDPIADGPTIQAASVRALKSKTTPKIVLELAREIKEKQGIPVVAFTYFNPIFKMGVENFFRLAQSCLVDGIVVPDLPVEEASDYKRVAEKFGLDTIFLAAPSTSSKRLGKIVECTSGFLYLVSDFGVTGEREKLGKQTLQLIKKTLPFTQGHVPLAVGFGVSKPEHVKAIIESGADGAIVGSAFVKVIQNNLTSSDRMLLEISSVARKLKDAAVRQQG